MKSTKFIKEIKRENCKYEIAKLKSLIKWKLSFGKKRKRESFHIAFLEKIITGEEKIRMHYQMIIISNRLIFCYMTLSLSKI